MQVVASMKESYALVGTAGQKRNNINTFFFFMQKNNNLKEIYSHKE